MFQQIWKRLSLRKKLDNLIQSKIDNSLQDYSIKSMYNLQRHWLQDYYDLRWKEIVEIQKVHSLEIFLQNNYKIRLYSDSLLSKYIYFNTFENAEIQFLTKFLKQGDTLFDIGSNIGLFSLYASPIVGNIGKVVCFEPASVTYGRLQENIALNSFTNIKAEKCALSNTNGNADLQLASDGYDAWNSIAKPTQGIVLQTEKIQTQTLDTYIQTIQNPEKISLLKIDVEGWEIPVLEGGKDFLSHPNAPILLVEFTEQNAINAGYSCKDLYNLIISYGYSLYSYNANTNELILESLREEYPYVNLIAIKDIESVYSRIK